MSKEVTMSQPSYGAPGESGESPQPAISQPTTPPPPPQSWGTPAPGSIPPGSMAPQDERNWAMGAHLSSFVAAWIALGVLGPLVVLLAVGNRSAFVRRHAVEALNWNISALIYLAVCIPLMFILIGFPMALVVGVCYVVFTIMGAMAASRGQEFRYPLTIRFVK